MAFERAALAELAQKLLDTVDAVSDGVDMQDVDEAVGLLTAFSGAADELKEDTDAAVLYLVSALLGLVGDRRRDVSA